MVISFEKIMENFYVDVITVTWLERVTSKERWITFVSGIHDDCLSSQVTIWNGAKAI